MSKFNKFLAVGALALGVAMPALAQDNSNVDNTPVLKNKIEQVLNKTIQNQFDKGFLTEKARLDLSLLGEEEVKKIAEKATLADDYALHISGAENQQGRVGNECVINIVFDKKGNIDDLFSKMSLQNDKQREIAQKFVTLHEHFHCEFSKIDKPVIAFGKDAEFQNNINYILKEQVSIPLVEKISYVDILNENYADAGAAMALLKEYGVKDKDINYVIKSIIETRKEGYAEQRIDSHFSQVSLEKTLSEENIKKLESADGKEFHKILLNIANEGTQDVMGNHAKLAQSFDSSEHAILSIQSKVLHTIFLKTFTPDELKSEKIIVSNLAPNVAHGMSYDFAQMSLEGIDLNKLAKDFRQATQNKELNNTLGTTGQHLLLATVSNSAIKYDLGSAKMKEAFEPIIDHMKKFAETFPKHEQKVDLSVSAITINKDAINARIDSIRKNATNNQLKTSFKPK
jgi:hypothetical protein